MSFIVRRIRPDEGLRLRALRLRALADAPSAFGSTLSREEAFAEGVWQERAARGATGETRVTYVAEDGDGWIGIATGIVDDLDGSRLELVGMFVEPAARNHAALKLYHRCGFRPTGQGKPLEHTPSLPELEMVRDV